MLAMPHGASTAARAQSLCMRNPTKQTGFSAVHSSAVLRTASHVFATNSATPYESIRSDVNDSVGLITIAKPKALNALSSQVPACIALRLDKHSKPALNCALHLQVMREIVHAARQHQSDDSVGAIIITGEGSKAFAAGADIKEMSTQSYSQVSI